jgi:16S rRNA (cytosine1407-C5)-methyltransferase
MNLSTASTKVERYREFLTAEEFERLLDALARDVPPAIRVNTLKMSIEAAQTWAETYGWDLQAVPFCPAGWQLEEYWPGLGGTLEHRMGLYYIQDAASMLPAEMFSLHDAPLILDMAAAPGGKTTHLVNRFEDRGLVIANDTSASRLAALRANLQSWGAVGVGVTNFPGELLGSWYPETFDRILLDAPCSGETLRENKGRKGREISAKEQGALCQRQEVLLRSAFHALKPGGEIVYSTCTLAPEEDEGILEGLLQEFPVAEIAQVAHLKLDAPGLASDDLPSLRNAVRLWPHLYGTSGFFAAKIIKTGSVPAPEGSSRPRAEAGFRGFKEAEVSALLGRWQQDYGFQFPLKGIVLAERGENLYAVPERLLSEFGDLPMLSAGLLIGQWMEDAPIPSHELISRYDSLFTGQRWPLTPKLVTAWLNGYDLREDLPGEVGQIILLEDEHGRFVGRGKRLKDRVRNLLPKRILGSGG